MLVKTNINQTVNQNRSLLLQNNNSLLLIKLKIWNC
jgi:hypothetical protein